MAHTRITSADVLLVNNAEEEIGAILQLQKQFPEFELFPAGPIAKTIFKTLVITADPTAAFRAVNAGRETTKPTLSNETVTCKYLDASWDIDGAAAKEHEWGVEDALAIYKAAAWRGALKALCTQIWAGTGGDANGFAGISSLYPNTDSNMVVNAAGTTESTASSVYMLGLNDKAFNLAWGNDATLDLTEVEYDTIPTSDGKTIWGYKQGIGAWCGVQLCDYEAGARICNLTADSGKGLTDALCFDAIEKFRPGKQPDVCFMSRRSLHQLRSSRTATNATGVPAPLPADIAGIPIYVTSSLTDTETLLAAAGT